MKLGFLELPAAERRIYIEEAATRRDISPVILEKDFWVCWLLGILFNSEFAGSLVFKGGTSLSKVFGIIETGRVDRRFGRRLKHVHPLEVIECLLAHRDFDCEPEAGNDLGRYRHLQTMVGAYNGACRLLSPESPVHASLRAATCDRLNLEVERDPSCVRLRGPRGQTLLHDAAMAGEGELAAMLIRSGADPDAKETEGHTPLYRASTGDVARVLLAAGAIADVTSGPTRGTALHQAARHGFVSVVQALLDHGASIDARDAKGETPLRRAVNCRQLEIVRLLVRHGATLRAADRRGVTPLDAARTAEMRQALADAGA